MYIYIDIPSLSRRKQFIIILFLHMLVILSNEIRYYQQMGGKYLASESSLAFPLIRWLLFALPTSTPIFQPPSPPIPPMSQPSRAAFGNIFSDQRYMIKRLELRKSAKGHPGFPESKVKLGRGW